MLGSALYYPFVDVRDRRWLRSAILFWDKIQTIVPSSIDEPYSNPDTRICEQEGYLQPLRCDFHPDILEKLGKRVLKLLESPEWLSNISRNANKLDPSIKALRHSRSVEDQVGHEFHLAGIYPEKMTPELQGALVKMGVGRLHAGKLPTDLRKILHNDPTLSRIHPEKLSQELKKLFGYRASYDGDWFLVDSDFAAAYMTALASMLARENRLSPLTTGEAYQGVTLRCLIDEMAGSGPSDANGVLLTVVMESLRIDPETPVLKLIAFRRSRETQLAELSGLFDELRTKIEKSETQRELENAAKRMLENKIRPGLESLKKELSDQSIQSGWEGFYQAATVSGAGGSLLAQSTDLSSAGLLGAGAFFTATSVAIKSIVANRRSRRASPYSYLLDIERKFVLPKFV